MRIRKIVLGFGICILIACDEDKPTGDIYAGKNTVECHLKGTEFECVETNPYVPISGDVEYDAIYGNGEISEFNWEKTLAWILPSEQHVYGFDLDPFSLQADYVENGKDVYASVKAGELAHVRLRVDPGAKSIYRFVKMEDSSSIVIGDIFNGQEICDRENCMIEAELQPGNYAVYYGDVDKKRYLHVLEYEEDVKNILYVQFGSENDSASCFASAGNGCYTRDLVEDRFNEIFKQAVVKGDVVEKKPQELGLDDTLIVDFTEELSTLLRLNSYDDNIRKSLYPEYKNVMETYSQATESLEKAVNAYNEMQKRYDECVQTKGSYACVYDSKKFSKARNQIEEWKSKKKSAYSNFLRIYKSEATRRHHVVFGINKMRIKWKLVGNTMEELKNFRDFNKACNLYHANQLESVCLQQRFPMKLKNYCEKSDKVVDVEMYEYDRLNNTFSLKLYGTGGLTDGCEYEIYSDVHPFVPSSPAALQYTLVFFKGDFNRTVIGGLVWGPHIAGDGSLNAICHEIGHSYGLTDLFWQDNDPTIFRGSATAETNLMLYTWPIGSRIRYRPLEVVETSTNERIKLKDGNYATENQWECIRSSKNCFK